MMKNLLFAIALMFSLGAIAQNGTITFTTMPDNVEAGTDAQFVVNYTSDVACKMNIALFKSEANSDQVDWNTWQAQMDVTGLAIAATETEKSFSFAVPGNIAASSTLPSGVQYIWALKLTGDNSEGDFAHNNAGNFVTITPSTTVVNNIVFTSTPPASVAAGEQVSIEFEYTLVEESNVKLSISKYTTGWSYVDAYNPNYFNNEPATTTTPTTKVISFTVPSDLTPTASLSGEMYKWDIGIYDTSWGYITNKTSDLTVTVATAVENTAAEKVNVFPNPVNQILNIEGLVADSEVKIYNVSGSLVKATVALSNLSQVDVSELSSGIYFVSVNGKQIKFIKE